MKGCLEYYQDLKNRLHRYEPTLSYPAVPNF